MPRRQNDRESWRVQSAEGGKRTDEFRSERTKGRSAMKARQWKGSDVETSSPRSASGSGRRSGTGSGSGSGSGSGRKAPSHSFGAKKGRVLTEGRSPLPKRGKTDAPSVRSEGRIRRPQSEVRYAKISDEQRLVGRNPLEEALKAGRPVHKLWVLKQTDERDGRLGQLIRLAEDKGVLIHEVDRAVLDRLAGDEKHQGVVAEVAAHAYADWETVLNEREAAGHDPMILILDEIQDGHNLGSILRVADAAGVDLVILPERRSVSLDAYVAKASAGAIEYVPVARVTNLSRVMMELKGRGYWIYGSTLDEAQDYRSVDYTGKVCLVIGNEGKGLSQKHLEHCDFRIQIPMQGSINSLNASVATGVLAFHIQSARGQLAELQV